MVPLFGIRLTLQRKTTRPTTVFALDNVRPTGQQAEGLKFPPASGVVGRVGQGTTLDCRRAFELVGTTYNSAWCLGTTRVNPPCAGDGPTGSTFKPGLGRVSFFPPRYPAHGIDRAYEAGTPSDFDLENLQEIQHLALGHICPGRVCTGMTGRVWIGTVAWFGLERW